MADETEQSPRPVATGPVPAEDEAADLPPPAVPSSGTDLERRRFFRHFASDLIQTAATVVGAANALQRTSAEAASALLDPAGTAARMDLDARAGGPARTPVFRTAFRLEGDALVLVDQRRLPDAIVEYECRTAADVAHAIRERVVRGAPAIGQVSALALALAANRMREARPYARRATLRGSANALVNARPASITVRRAVARMLDRVEAVGELSEEGAAIASALRLEADTIVFEATDAHGRIAGHGVSVLPFPADQPLRVLTLGNSGVLAGGQFGTALGVVAAAAGAGREVHVTVCETRPLLQGARLTAWELANAGIPHTLIADSAAASRLARGDVDVVLVAADRVAANGDVAAVVGSYPLAVLAARHGVPFVVCAPLVTFDPETPDGAALPPDERPSSELLWFGERRVAPPETRAANPVTDVTPAELISAIVTEEGVLRAPLGPALAEADESARRRRVPPPPFGGFVADATTPPGAAESPAADPAGDAPGGA